MQQFKLIPIAIHVVHGGDAKRIGMGDALGHGFHIGRALGRCGRWLRIAACDDAQRTRARRTRPSASTGAKASNSRNSPVANPSAPMTISLPVLSCATMQNARCFQRLGIGPNGVVVKAADGEGNISHDAVKHMPGDRHALAKLFMGCGNGMDEGQLRVLGAIVLRPPQQRHRSLASRRCSAGAVLPHQ